MEINTLDELFNIALKNAKDIGTIVAINTFNAKLKDAGLDGFNIKTQRILQTWHIDDIRDRLVSQHEYEPERFPETISDEKALEILYDVCDDCTQEHWMFIDAAIEAHY